VPSDFRESLRRLRKADVDPFAPAQPPEDPNTVRDDLDLFSHLGVTIPNGAMAFFDEDTATLSVLNTARNLELIESYIERLFKVIPKVIEVRVELYEVPKQRALELVKKLETDKSTDVFLYKGRPELDVRLTLEEWIAMGDARLLGAPNVVTRNGQRAKAESGQRLDFVSQYDEKDGKDVPRWSHVFRGTTMECDPSLDADGDSISVSLAVEIGLGEATITKRKIVGPGSGIERDVESVSIATRKLSTAMIVASGQTRLAGSMPAEEEGGATMLVFLTATVSLP